MIIQKESYGFYSPNPTRKGLGKTAVNHCLQQLSKDARVEKFKLSTLQFAYQCFEHFNFRSTRIEKEYRGKDIHLYELKKPKVQPFKLPFKMALRHL